MTKYRIQYESGGQWIDTFKLFDSMSLAELEAAFRPEKTRVIPVEAE